MCISYMIHIHPGFNKMALLHHFESSPYWLNTVKRRGQLSWIISYLLEQYISFQTAQVSRDPEEIWKNQVCWDELDDDIANHLSKTQLTRIDQSSPWRFFQIETAIHVHFSLVYSQGLSILRVKESRVDRYSKFYLITPRLWRRKNC
jgi:hypothetical protein